MNKANQIRNAAAKSDFSKWGSKKSFDIEWAAKLNVSRDCIRNARASRSWVK